jgi:hypothetical protein
MNKLSLFIFIVSACTVQEQRSFPVLPIADDGEWATYEGRWLTPGGVIRFELSLKSGAFGYDSYYQIRESFESDSLASGGSSQGLYSSYGGFPNQEFRICLHAVSTFKKASYLRYKKFGSFDDTYEMFFTTRGNDELLPCDNNYNPLTLDRRYTLHRRSKLFTVEGYFTVEQDSVEFFERNVMQYWKVTDLGEFNDLLVAYKKLAKEKYEGIYLKALAYSVRDSTSMADKDALVIKRILSLDNDPD